jgi:hypothetical protein
MASKDRITLVLAVNSTGTCKVPITMIGKAVKPMCFRQGVDCPVPYFGQPKAWMDSSTCQSWFDADFVPAVKQFTSKPVVVLWDGASTHQITCEDSQFTFIKLPPNTTSKLQPLDQGIIAWVKKQYRSTLVSKLIALIDEWHSLQLVNKPPGCKGIEQAASPNLLDVATIVETVWDTISNEIIINCFLKSGILPVQHQQLLQSLSIKSTLKLEKSIHLASFQVIVNRGPMELPQNASQAVIDMFSIPESCVGKVMDAWFQFET